jgi:hypothetical protein
MKNFLKDLNSKLKQLICSHNYGLVRWFYTHGPTTNEPAYIIAKYKCLKCGKNFILVPIEIKIGKKNLKIYMGEVRVDKNT